MLNISITEGGCGKPGHTAYTSDEGTCYCLTCELEQREAEIMDLEEEIGFLGGLYCIECPSVECILAREQAALAELHRGWRDQG